MPQVVINSSTIDTFSFSVSFDIKNRTIVFDTSSTTYQSGGESQVQGITFSLVDSDGVTLLEIDWDNPVIPDPSSEDTYTLDVSYLNYAYLFQAYTIIGGIKDEDDSIYYTTAVYKTVCKPPNSTSSGYVPGVFQLAADCPNNTLTVKELTVLTYNNKQPYETSKEGTLTYPTGTIDPIEFAGTPFTNDVIYTGQYRINCTTVGTYDLGDLVYVLVSYVTDNVFDVVCSNKMADLTCCILDLQNTYLKNCNTATGKHAKQQLDEISISYMTGLVIEISGGDASEQVAFIRKTLRCDCGSSSIHQNEMTPINPAVTNIVLQGVYGTSIGAPTVVGNTKTYTIASNTYVVAKGDTGDLSFTITIDNSVVGTTKYKITFNYTVLAQTILNTIENNDTLLTQLNSLIDQSNFDLDLSGLDGKCVIDISQINYFLSWKSFSASNTVKNIIIGSNTYNAPGGTTVNNPSAIVSWLNGLGFGVFEASYSNPYVNILSTANTNPLVSMTFTTASGDVTVNFQKTNASLVAVLQAIVDYLCGITTLQVALYRNLTLCQFDYNGNIVTAEYSEGSDLDSYLNSVSTAICNLADRIADLTGVTCTKLKSIFIDRPGVSFTNDDRFYGTLGGDCAGLTDQQAAIVVFGAVSKYSNVKALFCDINCETPATCPEVSGINMSMAGDDIGIYGVTWATTPNATQTVTVKFKIHSAENYTTSTNALQILPNGNVLNSPPYLITSPIAGTTYDIWITNNCGGEGFVGQITTPSDTVYSGTFYYDSVLYDVCDATPNTLYSSAPFATGVIMYTDLALTTPLAGYTYIADSTGAIYEIDSVTGLVGDNTGLTCGVGVEGEYILGNDTDTICEGSPVTLYTDGVFEVGKTLYSDSSLTTPVTGYDFVVDTSDNVIYDLDNATGEVLSTSGLSCTPTLYKATINNISGGFTISEVSASGGQLHTSTDINTGESVVRFYVSGTFSIAVTITNFGFGSRLRLYRNFGELECIPVTTTGIYTFASQTYNNTTDTILITLSTGFCS